MNLLSKTLACAVLLVAAPFAQGQFVWSGAGGNNNWSTAANWAGTVPVANGGAGSLTQTVAFAGTTRLAPTLSKAYSVNSLAFDSGAGAFTIGLVTHILTLDGAAPTILQQSANAQVISATSGSLALAANSTIDVSAAGNLTISAPISGAFSLTSDGTSTGALILSGANTFSGGLTVKAGVTQVSTSNAVLGTGTTTVDSGGTLQITDARTLTNAMTLNGAGSGASGALDASPASGTATLSGVITLGSASTINVGSGTLALTNAGTGIAGAGENLTLSGTGAANISTVIGTGTGTVTLNGTGITTYSKANTYTGLTTVNAGTLTFSSGAGVTGIQGDVTVNGGASNAGTVTLTQNNQLATTSNLTVNGGTVDGQFNLGNKNQTVASLNGSSGGTVALGTGILTVAGGGTSVYAGSITGSGTLVQGGTGILEVAGTNPSFTGSVTVSKGTLQTNVANAFSGTTPVTVDVGATLNLNGNSQSLGTLADSGALILGSNTLETLTLGTGASSLSGTLSGSGTLILDSGSVLTLGANFSDASLTIELNGGALMLNGTTDTFGSLLVNASGSVLDFASPKPSVLTVGDVTFTGASTLAVSNWSNATDYFYSSSDPGTNRGSAPLNQITFDTPTWTGASTAWMNYVDGPGNSNQITPVPESSLYGFVFVGLLTAGFILRRREQAA